MCTENCSFPYLNVDGLSILDDIEGAIGQMHLESRHCGVACGHLIRATRSSTHLALHGYTLMAATKHTFVSNFIQLF